MHVPLIALLTLCAQGAATAEETAPPASWSLADCLRYAVEHSPRLEAERFRLLSAHESVREAEAGDDLRTGLSAGLDHQYPEIAITIGEGERIVIAPATQATLAVQAALPIDISHLWRYTRQAANHSESAQRERYRQALEQLLLEVTTAYYQTLAAKSAVRAAAAGVGASEGEVRRVEARARAGSALDVQVAIAESDLASARESQARAEGLATDAGARLATLLGLPADEPPALVDAPLELETALTWDEAREVALKERPELSALEQAALALGASASAIRAQTKPSLALTAGGVLQNPPSGLGSPSTVTAGLSFSWPIGGNGSARASARRAERDRDALLQDLADTRLLIENQVQAVLTRLGTLVETLAADEAARAEAERVLHATRARREAGLANAQDVAAAEALLVAAEARIHRNRCDLSIARAEWARCLGVLSRITIPELAGSAAEEERP